MKYLEQNLDDLSAIAVLDILIQDFDAAADTICFNATQRIVTLGHLQEEYKGLKGALAKHIGPLKFQGGPKTHNTYYTGNLLTVLMDYILIEWVYTGSYADMVEREMVL